MKIKSVLLLCCILITAFVSAQDEYGGVTENNEEPGPFMKYGWFFIAAIILYVFIKTRGATKNNR